MAEGGWGEIPLRLRVRQLCDLTLVALVNPVPYQRCGTNTHLSSDTLDALVFAGIDAQ